MTLPPDLIASSPSGLYCPPGDFHVDPHHRVPLAVITHAHGDHVRSGCSRYVCALPSLQLVRERTRGARKIEGIPFGQVVTLGATRVSFHPSGHILGSAQVRIEHDGRVWVVSGDYKRQPDPTCPPFEVVRCDTFVTEATFAHPRFVFDDGATIAREVHAWWQENAAAQRTSLLFTYPLGKTQRLLAELARLTDRGVFVHPHMLALIGIYRDAGVAMLATTAIDQRPKSYRFEGDLVLLPPQLHGVRPLRRFADAATGFASGWMLDPAELARRGYHRGFVLSDHADWNGLMRTIDECGAKRIIAVHGDATELVAACRARGLDAEAWTED